MKGSALKKNLAVLVAVCALSGSFAGAACAQEQTDHLPAAMLPLEQSDAPQPVASCPSGYISIPSTPQIPENGPVAQNQKKPIPTQALTPNCRRIYDENQIAPEQ
jgi:hypothetical protein